MHTIFISYRREESIETAGRIYDWLDSRLAPNSIFMDVDSILPGADFRAAIKDTITSVSVMLVVIGPRWLTVRDPNGGAPRIDNPSDFVRIEVELAIQNNIPIIPVLVQEAPMPAADDLPTSLTSLAYRNAVKIRPNPDFQRDMLRVMKGIESVDSEIVFSQQTEKANEHVEKEPPAPKPELPPIPEGGRSEYGFYYTRIVARQINSDSKSIYDDEDRSVRKEFALRDSPTSKHEVMARFRVHSSWNDRFLLDVTVDDQSVTTFNLNPNAKTNEVITTYGPDYARSVVLDGHTYNIAFKIDVTYTIKGHFPVVRSWSYKVSKFEVAVDGYTLLDPESLWD